jgi:hypothetical protein
MKRKKIEGSSNIAEVGYQEETLTLQIKFKHGGIYNYSPITEFGYQSLIQAESKGGFFAQNIKYGKGIKCVKVG